MSYMEHLFVVAWNKKIIIGWLLLLTSAIGTIGEKVYVDRTRELTQHSEQLRAVQDDLIDIKQNLRDNGRKLDRLLQDTAALKAELSAHKETDK